MQAVGSLLETVHVDGVVVLLNKDNDYAYVHTVGLGRTLLSPIGNKEDIKLGTWLSLTVTNNRDTVLSYEKTRCRYTAVGRTRSIDDVVPTGIRLEKSGLELIRVQTEAIIGSIRENGTIALSQHVGRIFVNPKLCESMKLKSLIWVDLGVQSVEPSEANAQCFWMAKTAATIEDDGKYKLGIRKCHGHFAGFLEKNVCLLELSGNDEGYVWLRPSDFYLPIPLKKLREAKAIEVYANLAVSSLKSFPVSACCARVLEEDELKTLCMAGTNSATAGEDVNVTAIDERNIEESKENSKCNHVELLRQLMHMEHVAMELQKMNSDLYQRITNFLGNVGMNA